MPVLCFAAIGFAGPPLSARYRDSHVLAAALRRHGGRSGGAGGRTGSFWLFLAGTVLAMVGGALGNVLLPSLVKRYFPQPHRPARRRVQHRHGDRRRPWSRSSTAPIAAAVGADGWRWALGIWAVPALLAALPWLAVPARPGASRADARRRPDARPACTAGWPWP